MCVCKSRLCACLKHANPQIVGLGTVVTADDVQQKNEALKEQREKVLQAERRLSRGINVGAATKDGSFTS